MGSRTAKTRRLRLHRETLRTVSAQDLAEAAGGGGYISVSAACGLSGAPKSTIWTGGVTGNGVCTA